MPSIDTYSFHNKKALVRVDFNVPLFKDDFSVQDDTRMRAALPTIQKILADGGSVVLMSHLGRPKGEQSDGFSLHHIVSDLGSLLNKEICL